MADPETFLLAYSCHGVQSNLGLSLENPHNGPREIRKNKPAVPLGGLGEQRHRRRG